MIYLFSRGESPPPGTFTWVSLISPVPLLVINHSAVRGTPVPFCGTQRKPAFLPACSAGGRASGITAPAHAGDLRHLRRGDGDVCGADCALGLVGRRHGTMHVNNGGR